MVSRPADLLIWSIIVLSMAGVIARPWRLPEYLWAVAGALVLVLGGLLPVAAAWRAVGRGVDVYLFLIGMMLISELARIEGLFDVLAALAARRARGSAARLFLLVYAVGTLVTILLSNDATAVVLTPAVIAVTRTARATPLPYLLICALVANAASFVLPISNPANLVVYASHMPALTAWVARFGVASVLSILATYAVLRWRLRADLRGVVATDIAMPPMRRGAWAAAAGIAGTAILLLLVSGFGLRLGLPTALAGVGTLGLVLAGKRRAAGPALRDILRGMSWGVLPLVAGLFVLVAGLGQTGVLAALVALLRQGAVASVPGTAWAAGILLAVTSNLMNNLPAGLIAGATLAAAAPPRAVSDALLIGVDLGPNLSVTGSLATILWLTALRREGISVGFWQFLGIGALVMPPALLLALAAALLT